MKKSYLFNSEILNSLTAVLLLSVLSCRTNVRLTIINPSPFPVIVQVINTNDKENPQRSTSVTIPAGKVKVGSDGKPIIGEDGRVVVIASSKVVSWKNIRKLSKIKFNYQPEGSDARASIEPPLIVHNSSEIFDHVVSLRQFDVFDEKISKNTIMEIGSSLSPSGAPIAERLIDIVPILGSVVVATFKNDPQNGVVAEMHGSIFLKPIKIEHTNAIEIRGSTVTKQSIVSEASLSVPIYGNVASSMSGNHLFNLAWSIKHYPFLNSQFNLGEALETAKISELKAIIALLQAHPDSTIAVIHRVHVIESASFGVTEGKSFNANFDSAIASVFTAKSAYQFHLSDEKFITLPSLVVNINYQRQVDRERALKTLKLLIDMKDSTDAKGRPLSNRPLPAEQIREIELNDIRVINPQKSIDMLINKN